MISLGEYFSGHLYAKVMTAKPSGSPVGVKIYLEDNRTLEERNTYVDISELSEEDRVYLTMKYPELFGKGEE